MKKILPIVAIFCYFQFSIAQVGINETDPQAQLEISVADPANPSITDGILIPRLSTFPAANPTAAQDGMLVFLSQPVTAGAATYNRGFYYWNHALTQWKPLLDEDKNFYVFNTTQNPTSIADDVYRTGKLSVGNSEDTGKVNIVITNDNVNVTAKPKTALYIENNHPSTGSSYTTYGIDVENNSAVNGPTYGIRVRNSTSTIAAKYGLLTEVTATGDGTHYGIYNEVSQGSTSLADMYGIKNHVNKTHGATSNNYGIYNEIGSTTSAGTIYGIYSKATGNTTATVYSGYFLGRFAVGMTPTNNYLLPASRGTAGQVLTAAANGETVWSTNGTQNVTSITSPITTYTLTPSISTLRITAVVTNLAIPDATLMPGKIFRIINGHNNNSINLTSQFGQTIHNDVTGTTVTSLAQNRRLTIQSNGTNWFVIDN